MVLSDRQIKEALEDGSVIIEPLADKAIQPSSVDLHTDRYFRVFRNDHTPYIDPKAAQEDLTELVEVADGEAFILHPGEFVLGSTLERVALGNDLVARLGGQELARAGSGCSFTARPASSMQAGTGTSRSSSRTSRTCPIAIYPGMKIGQISFLQMTSEAEHPYGSDETGSKYKGQQGPDPVALLPQLPRVRAQRLNQASAQKVAPVRHNRAVATPDPPRQI